MSDETIPGQLVEIQARLDDGDARMTRIESSLEANTAVTTDIKDILEAGRLGLKVLGWIGAAAKWVGLVAAGGAALWGFFHQGAPK